MSRAERGLPRRAEAPRRFLHAPMRWLRSLLRFASTAVPALGPCWCSAAAQGPVPGFDPATGVITSQRWASGVPLGGMGCGTFELMTDGSVSNVAINNNWDRPTGDVPGAFAALWTNGGGRTRAVALKLTSEYGLPTVAALTYRGLYPQAVVTYPDTSLPVSVTLRAFTPLIPGDRRNSSLPVAVFSFTVRNEARAPVEAAIAVSWENLLGVGATPAGAFADRTGTAVVQLPSLNGYYGLRFDSPGRPAPEPTEVMRYNAWGEYALLAHANTPETRVTHATWNALDAKPSWWDGFARTGEVDGTSGPGVEGKVHPAGVVCMRLPLEARETRELAFAVSWFTRRLYVSGGTEYGHIYEKSFRDAANVAGYVLQNRASLAALTSEWQTRLSRSSLPPWLWRKLINDASTLTTSAVYTRDDGVVVEKGRAADPLFAALEDPGPAGTALGGLDHRALRHGLLSAWFPRLDAVELEGFAAGQNGAGALPRVSGDARTEIPGRKGPATGAHLPPQADVAAAYVFQVWTSYRSTGDRAFLERHYPVARAALDWAAALDSDEDGIPDGPTMYGAAGPASYQATTWLAATRLGEAMADAMNDASFATRCRQRHERARGATLARVWNGRFLGHGAGGSLSFSGQLAGQWMADAADAGDLLPPDVLAASLDALAGTHAGSGAVLPPTAVDTAGGHAVDAACRPSHAAAFQAALLAGRGRVDAALALLERIDRAVVQEMHTPWRLPLAIVPGGAPIGRSHMSAPASWAVLDALTGVRIDVPAGRLTITPRLPSTMRSLEAPVFAPTAWAWLDYRPGTRTRLALRIDRVTSSHGLEEPGPSITQSIRSAPGIDMREIVLPSSDAAEPDVQVSVGRSPVQGKVSRDGRGRWVFTPDTPLKLIAGQRLSIELSAVEPVR